MTNSETGINPGWETGHKPVLNPVQKALLPNSETGEGELSSQQDASHPKEGWLSAS